MYARLNSEARNMDFTDTLDFNNFWTFTRIEVRIKKCTGTVRVDAASITVSSY